MNLLAPEFQDEDAARAYLEGLRWPEGPVCPHCGGMKAYKINPKEGSKTRKGLYKCGDCRKQYTVTVGTIFHRSKVPLNKWLLAAYLMASSKKGFAAHQLHRSIDVQYKTAWFMMHRLREAMKEDAFLDVLGGEGKVVEVDETYWGNSRSKDIEPVRGGHHKEKVFALVERKGKMHSFHVATVTAENLQPMMRELIDERSKIMTDGSTVYTGVDQDFASHDTVNHSAEEFVRYAENEGEPDIHTQTIDGAFSMLKRGLSGVYHHVSPAHLHRYLSEFDFRYNRRETTDAERADQLLKGIEGKRLLYRRPDSGETTQAVVA